MKALVGCSEFMTNIFPVQAHQILVVRGFCEIRGAMPCHPLNHDGDVVDPSSAIVSKEHRRINKRKKIVDMLRQRYNKIVPESELDAILPDPTESMPKRAWEVKMFEARTKLLDFLDDLDADEPCFSI